MLEEMVGFKMFVINHISTSISSSRLSQIQ